MRWMVGNLLHFCATLLSTDWKGKRFKMTFISAKVFYRFFYELIISFYFFLS